MSGLTWISNPADTRGPLIQGVFWTLLAVSSITIGLRLWIKWTHRRLQPDDYCLIFAWLSLLALTITMQLAVYLGLGKHALDVPLRNLDQIARYGAASLSLSIIGLAMAKISFAVTLLYLTKDLWRWSNWFIWSVIATLTLFSIPISILPWVQCKPLAKTFVDLLPGTCINKSISINLGIFLASFSALVDFLFALMPWKILWALQMRPVEKFGVGIAMSLGAIAGVMAIMRASTVNQLEAQDMSYDGILAVLWGDIELSTTIIAACIPVLRKMIHEEVSTRTMRSGGSYPKQNSKGGTGQGQRRKSHSYQLSRLSGRKMGGGLYSTKSSKSDDTKSHASGAGGSSLSGKWYKVYQREGAAQQSDESVMLHSSKPGEEHRVVVHVKGERDRMDSAGGGDDHSKDDPVAPDSAYFGGDSVRYPIVRGEPSV